MTEQYQPNNDYHPEEDGFFVAVATKGEGRINLHFGQADDFAIYAVGPQGIRYVVTRKVADYYQAGYEDEDKREVILRALADCAALFAARIGDGPKDKLSAAGIKPVDDFPSGLIEASINEWLTKNSERHS